MEQIRYGIVGVGMMGIEHLHNLLAIDGAVVSALADPHPPSIEQGLSVLGSQAVTPRVFADHRAMLDAGECDAVVISSPNSAHEVAVLDALEAGVHILVEKPLCTTVAACRRVLDAAAATERVVWVGLEYRYMPPVARLLSELARGTVGPVRMVSIREHRFPFLPKIDDWNRFTSNTGGTLVEKCCHFFDLMNLIAGSRPVRVMASGGQDVNHLDERYDGRVPDILDNAYVIVDYESGVRAMLDLCMFAEATHNQEELAVVGERGKIEALIPENVVRIGIRGEHWIGGVETETVVDPSIAYEGHHHGSSYVEHLHFADAIRHGRAAEVTLSDGLWSVLVGEAAQHSIESGAPVMLDARAGSFRRADSPVTRGG